MNKSRERLSSIDSDIRSNTDNINSYENSIRACIEQLNANQAEKMFIEENLKLNGKGIFDEIEKTKTLPFIKEVDIGADYIDLTYNECTIKIPDFMRGDHGKSFGTRTTILGEVKIRISPSSFIIYNTIPLFGHSHPHSSGNPGSPCLGGGDGRNKIYELLASNKFVEMAKMLWFWIKTYRNSGAYVKMWDFYDDRLKNGLPIWDEKGVRIEFNDPERIKSGEQRTGLTKLEYYEANIKKFEKTKLF